MSPYSDLHRAYQRTLKRAQQARDERLRTDQLWQELAQAASTLVREPRASLGRALGSLAVVLFLLTSAGALRAQSADYVTTVRGVVVERDTRQPLAGATVALRTDTTIVPRGMVTNERGEFVFKNVRVGRLALVVRYLGYQDRLLQNLLATTGRELVLDIEMTESVITTQAVEITARQGSPDEGRTAANELSLISARSFTPEQAFRFAGSLADPTRMAANFAGVSGGGDTRNDLVIRGNSPIGMLWRLEGVDIYNPNHFATQGANGGPISLLNNNVLGSSDFVTGAFAAEYGNATSGVFDLKLRNGNTGRRESLFAIGFNGFELQTEGPFKKGGRASYLINYRYSTLDIFDAIGISFGDLLGIPRFQDLSVKLNFPTNKLGTFGLFAVGGASRIGILETDLTDQEFKEKDDDLSFTDIRQFNQRGTAGLTHAILIGENGVLKTVLSAGIEERTLGVDTLVNNRTQILPLYNEEASNYRLTASVQYTHKFSAQHTLRIGGFADQLAWKWRDEINVGSYLVLPRTKNVLRDIDEQTTLLRAYAQYAYRPSDRLTVTVGAHGQYFQLNEQGVVEPRASIRYGLSPKSTVTLGYGLHHQIQSAALYFVRATDGSTPNTSLAFNRSNHFVLGYETSLGQYTRLKAETYYQSLDQLPIDRTSSSFSGINTGLGFGRFPEKTNLSSTGTGQNVGVELTLERFLHKGFYYLVTASVFDSKYKGSDGVERNTAFNNQYVVNALAGLELKSGRSGQNAWIIDFKLAVAGGIRYTPIDLAASKAAGSQVDDPSRIFSLQTKPYFRPDLKFGYRFNYRRWSQEVSVTLQNFTGNANVLTLNYNPRAERLVERSQLGFFPVVQYTLRFQGKE